MCVYSSQPTYLEGLFCYFLSWLIRVSPNHMHVGQGGSDGTPLAWIKKAPSLYFDFRAGESN